MVFFVCCGCNESLKKQAVEKHVYKCGNCWAVTCVDCSQTFEGEDYKAHTSCVSEAEKYEGSLYKGKKVKLNPQQVWMALVEEAARNSANAPAPIRSYLSRMSELAGCVPRQEKKFRNFVANSLKIHNQVLVSQLWTHLVQLKPVKEEKKSEPEETTEKEPVAAAAAAGAAVVAAADSVTGKAPKRKRQRLEKGEGEAAAPNSSIKWKKVVKSLMQEHGKLSIKELRRHVLAKLRASGVGEEELSKEVVAERVLSAVGSLHSQLSLVWNEGA